MEAAGSSKTLVAICQATCSHSPENHNLNIHHQEKPSISQSHIHCVCHLPGHIFLAVYDSSKNCFSLIVLRLFISSQQAFIVSDVIKLVFTFK
jgi:hypothetical protein